MDERTCGRCGLTKPASAFTTRKRDKDGLQHWCRGCMNEYRQKRDKANPDSAKAKYRRHYAGYGRKWKLLQKYGISLQQYNEMLEAQCGVCAICMQANPDGRALAVDHDHKTGRVRGLLCVNCNLGIGYLGDNWQTLAFAADYLKQNTVT